MEEIKGGTMSGPIGRERDAAETVRVKTVVILTLVEYQRMRAQKRRTIQIGYPKE